jgi:ring-1,2-phenylacetyl-CoA epoxidase subunit PaaA
MEVGANQITPGELIESVREMSDEYKAELKHTLTVSGDTELISAPAYYLAARRAPSINAFMTAMAIIQDELAHAHIAYHLLEGLGEQEEEVVFSRPALEWRYPYAFDVPLTTWTELVVANTMYDQAGFCLLGDIHEACSYGPWKRGLNKVMVEENFHLRNGRQWTKRLAQAGGQSKTELQQAVDWMFPLTVEWFGLPDSLKQHSRQVEYGLKSLGNDALRQWWLCEVVPHWEAIGIQVPAHKVAEGGGRSPSDYKGVKAESLYSIDFAFPCEFDAEGKRWDFAKPCTWDDVLERWRARGPRNAEMVAGLQEEHWKFKQAQSG